MRTLRTDILILMLLISIAIVKQVVLEDLVSLINDEVVRQTVQEFRELCPYTKLCSFNDSKTLPEATNSTFEPTSCCAFCECSDCGISCCPDKLDVYLSDTEVNRLTQDPVPCLRLQYKTVTENTTLLQSAFYTVSVCPPGYVDVDVQRRCLRDYQDFEFEEDLSHLVPVSFNDTIFKNKYCAICNGVDLSSLHYWDTKVTCQIPATLPVVTSLKELKSALDETEKCDLFFSSGDHTYIEKFCDSLIDRCNMTGLSQPYHPDTERACLSYMSVYKKRYRNVHCYLCNKKSEDEIQEICKEEDYGYQPNSFVALLDFKGLVETLASAEVKHDHCTEDHVYDVVLNTCRLTTCPDFMTVTEGKCELLFLSISEYSTTVYDVIITVEPRDSVKRFRLLPGSIESIYESLQYHVSDSLELRQSKFAICQLYGVIFLESSITELTDDFVRNNRHHLELSEIRYFAFRLQLTSKIDTFLKQELETLDDVFENLSMGPFLMPYVVRYRTIPFDIFETAMTAHDIYQSAFAPPSSPELIGLVTYWVMSDALAASFHYELNNITIAPLYRISYETCFTVSTYHVQMFCPKILFSPEEFNLTEDGVVINDVNLFLPNHEIEFTFNNSVYVCSNNYLSSIAKIKTNKLNEDDSEIEPLMILTIILLSLSLISLFITFVIYALLKELRNLPGLNIMGLVSSLFGSHLLTLLNGVVKIRIGELCIAFGIALHFALLLAIFWMFVCTFHMGKVFIKLEKMHTNCRTKYQSLIRYVCFTITMSVMFVVINISVSAGRSSIGYDDVTCYLDSSDMLLFTVALPIGLVVILNLAMFIGVVIKVGRIPSMKTHSTNDRNNFTIFIKLSTLTGITWCFGFLYQFSTIKVLAYAFVVLNASQGVFIMISFVLNKRVTGKLKSSYFSHFESNPTGNLTLHSPSNARKGGTCSMEHNELSKL